MNVSHHHQYVKKKTPKTNGDLLMEEENRLKRKSALNSSQNLPAVLNDPNKGKQKDFFTRSWGVDFNETNPVPSSPFAPDLPPKSFDKYLKKVRKYNYRSKYQQRRTPQQGGDDRHEKQVHGVIVTAPRLFSDPNFDLTRPETFSAVFRIPVGTKETFCQTVKTDSGSTHEKLTHQLDQVEVEIARQCSAKSHHFFQVMTYHDALMTQLVSLLDIVKNLRAKLRSVDENSLKPSFELCKLKRRRENLDNVVKKLALMHFIHSVEPTIQSFVSSSEFSGALDLITTSVDILSIDLKNVSAFKHLHDRLAEFKHIIGQGLAEDFGQFLKNEVHKETVYKKATSLNGQYDQFIDFDVDHLRSLIYGLLRENSYSFLESLEDASSAAIKKVLGDVVSDVTRKNPAASNPSSRASSPNPAATTSNTTANIVAEFARVASSEEWIDLFDNLAGSLLILLNRVYKIHEVVKEAIESTNEMSENSSHQAAVANTTVAIPETQLQNLLTSNKEVLINVSESMHQRVAKYLAMRAKPGSECKIIPQELTSIGLLISIFSEETFAKSGRQCNGLQLSLQSQSVLYVQTFDEEQRAKLTEILEADKWKRSKMDMTSVVNKMVAIPSMKELFSAGPKNGNHNKQQPANGMCNEDGGPLNGKDEHLGRIDLMDASYVVTDFIPSFLKIIAEYCNLCSMLPIVTIELGLKTAEMIKLLNSRVCQLILGAAAVTEGYLRTITIRNLALASRDLQVVARIIPHVLIHFQTCYTEKTSPSAMPNGGTSPPATKAESKQFEFLQRQFDQASKHVKNHCDEIAAKIQIIVGTTFQKQLTSWKPPPQIPSNGFKILCKHLRILHESTVDVWPVEHTRIMFSRVHEKFLNLVHAEIRNRCILFDSSAARALQAELVFYGQSLKMLNVLQDESQFSRERFEALWGSDLDVCDSD